MSTVQPPWKPGGYNCTWKFDWEAEPTPNQISVWNGECWLTNSVYVWMGSGDVQYGTVYGADATLIAWEPLDVTNPAHLYGVSGDPRQYTGKRVVRP